MSDSTSVILQQAHQLIENDELEQARSILAPLLETDAENPSLWWVYAHALRDRSIGQLALDRVIALDPSYPGAAELKADVLALHEQDDDFLTVAADNVDKAQSAGDSPVDEWEELQPLPLNDSDASGSRLGFVLLVVILLVVASGAALFASGAIDLSDLLSGILPTPEPALIVVLEPTPEALAELEASVTPALEETAAPATAFATSVPELEPTSVETAAVATDAESIEPTSAATVAATENLTAEPSSTAAESNTPLAEFVRDVAEDITEFDINRPSSGVENTSLGETLVLQLCAIPGREFNERLNQVMNAVVSLADTIPEGLDAVAAGLLNCPDPNASLRIIGVAVEAIKGYAEEEIDEKDFQRAWQPLP